MKMISAHSHLLADPQELEILVESGIFSQIWLLGLSPKRIVAGFGTSAGDEDILAAAKRFPGFFMPFKWVDYRKGPDQIDRAVEQGYIGFKGIYPPKSYDDESFYPIYERIASYHCPMLFHTGYVSTPPYAKRCEDYCYQAGNMRPASLYTVARLFPEITVIAAHFGLPWAEELLDMEICLLPNFYIDLSGGHTKEILKIVDENADRPAVLPGGEKGIFADKFLVGIDAYLGHPQLHRDVIGSSRFFMNYFEQKMTENISWAGSIPGILSGNAERIMKENKLLQ